ncbi:DUF3955 domain-containing protein [Ruegeria sp. EL01]|uniref:DUF3955 domain-containing protein n=1 Tax=Ruegeria sp. EL01 TaxID=2107578 RepID=UPI0013C47BAB|nr:DUF3955 domain-containing protein [Ruegeria sp. EL01]
MANGTINMRISLKSIGIFLIVLALVFWLCEQIFFGGLTEDGFLEESLFLPLGYLIAATGAVVLIVNWYRNRG